jgi:hypothetical protein
MKSGATLKESIYRFKSRFWERTGTGRPPVGIVEAGSFLPVQYLKDGPLPKDITIEDIRNASIDTDYDFDLQRRKVFSDDFIPYVAAWRAIPWLEAICGCPVHYSSGSLAPGQFVSNAEDLLKCESWYSSSWNDYLIEQTGWLNKNAANDCWVSPTIIRGISDVFAAMRGMDNFFTDLLINTDIIDRAGTYLAGLTQKIIEKHFSIVEPKFGGYGHIYGYWSPQRTNVFQDDAIGMVDPEIFREIFLEKNNMLVSHLGGNAFFHLHSTGFAHYKHVMEIKGLSGIEFTIEQNGPPLRELTGVFQEILGKCRLILFIDAYFEQLNEVLKKLPADGLYILIPSRYIGIDPEFKAFINSNWRNT